MSQQESSTLNLLQGTALSLGSIIGSGLLFLSALSYKVGGSHLFYGWILSIFITIPLIILFCQMVKKYKNASPIGDLWGDTLGQHFSHYLPYLMLFTTLWGIPCSLYIVSQYVSEIIHLPAIFITLFMLALAYGINFSGLKVSARTQLIITLIFFILAFILYGHTFSPLSFTKIFPSIEGPLHWKKIFNVALLSFWAFAGVENLSFLSRKFKNPNRDFPLSIGISFTLCAFLYWGLTSNYVATIPYQTINEKTGLLQLTTYFSYQSLFMNMISLMAFLSVLMNLISWILGLSEMISSSAKKGIFPFLLQGKKAMIFLLFGQLFFSFLLYANESLLNFFIGSVSANFVLIYFISAFCFFLQEHTLSKKIIIAFIVLLLFLALYSSLSFLWYASFLYITSSLIYFIKQKREEKKSIFIHKENIT